MRRLLLPGFTRVASEHHSPSTPSAHLPARTMTTRGSAVSYKQAKGLVMIVMGSFMLELPSLGMRHLSGGLGPRRLPYWLISETSLPPHSPLYTLRAHYHFILCNYCSHLKWKYLQTVAGRECCQQQLQYPIEHHQQRVEGHRTQLAHGCTCNIFMC